MKNRIQYLGSVIVLVIFFTIMFTKSSTSFDSIGYFFPLLAIVSSIWEIYLRLKYRSGKPSDQLRVHTNNDDYNRIAPFLFGSSLTVGGFFALKYMESDILLSLIIVTGILSLINGFLFIPSGIIEIKHNELTVENGKQKQTIEIKKLNNIDLKSSDIILNAKNGKKHYVNHMNLNESDYQKIKEFLNQKLKNKIEIKTYGDSV